MSDLLHVTFVARHPWMFPDLCNSWSIFSFVAEHLDNEILKFIRQVLSSGLLPVSGIVTVQKQIVEVLILLGLLKWENTLNNDEKNDSSGKHVDLTTIIGFIFFNFGCHVSHSASVRLQIMDFSESGESEICHLQIHVFVDQDIFKFEVSVNDSFSVHVFKDIAHLVQEETTSIFAHATKSLAHIEKETTSYKLEKNVNKVVNFSS